MVEIEKIEKPEELSALSTDATSTKHENPLDSDLKHSELDEECTKHAEGESEENKANIYIQTGEALTPEDSEKTIQRIKNLFEVDEESN